jgi:hypothetical protein
MLYARHIYKNTLDKFVGAIQIAYHRKTWDTLVRSSARGLATAVIDRYERWRTLNEKTFLIFFFFLRSKFRTVFESRGGGLTPGRRLECRADEADDISLFLQLFQRVAAKGQRVS